MTHDRPIRVLQILDNLGMGGAETWLMELLRFWSSNKKVETDFVITGGNVQLFDEEARDLGARLHYIPYKRAFLRSFSTGFRRVLINGRYDALHDHQDYASGLHYLMAAGALPPVRVTHVHNPWLHIEANYAVSPARRLTTSVGKHLVGLLATHVCGTSAEILKRYGFKTGNHQSPKVSVVHCGFDPSGFCGFRQPDRDSVLAEFHWPQDARVVLFAGRLDRSLEFDHPQNHKNSWFALNVVRAAISKDPSVRFLMAGAGDSRPELEKHIESWGLAGKMRLISVRQDMPRLMRAADALLFPSRQEGLGMVAVESQASGTPVLASSAVPRECIIVPDLYNALPLTAPVDTWARRLIEIAARPRISMELSLRALEGSGFAIANSAGKLEKIYRGTPR